MNKKAAAALGCSVLFLLLIAALFFVDVAPIGTGGTRVGLAGLNGAAREAFGESAAWYRMTQLLGALSLAVAAAFGCLGIAQMIRRRSLLRVDRRLLLLGALYLATILAYLLFEKAVVNRRPVLLPGETYPEASFPSSHTMLTVVVMGSAFLEAGRIRRPALRRILRAISACTAAAAVAGRILSGVHWLTDVAGGALLGAALVLAYAWALERYAR